MSSRSIWSGAISFGMVTIPVKLYAATGENDGVTFRQVHREDGARIQQRRICSADGTEVPYADVAKGYELPGGSVVILTDEDMAELPLATAKTIEVLQFIPVWQVDPIMAHKAYYLAAEPAGMRAYALLRQALTRSKRVALAKVALRRRESLAVIGIRDNGTLALHTLLWPDELRSTPPAHTIPGDAGLSEAELSRADTLIAALSGDFSPADHKDEYRQALIKLVDEKVAGNQVIGEAEAITAGTPDGKQYGDLSAILQASVDAIKAERAQDDPEPAAA